jgi:hypothetical protein
VFRLLLFRLVFSPYKNITLWPFSDYVELFTMVIASEVTPLLTTKHGGDRPLPLEDEKADDQQRKEPPRRGSVGSCCLRTLVAALLYSPSFCMRGFGALHGAI